MAPGRDVNARLAHKLRRAPVQREGALGQRAQCVQRGQGAGHAGEGGHEGLQLVQQLLVQPFFPGQCPLLRAQGFVFKGLELGRDETLGVFKRLAAAVIVWHFVDLALRDLDVKAMHLVVLHAQIGNAGAGFLALFQGQQKVVAVNLDGPQLVQLGIQARGDHAAIADQRSGLLHHRERQQCRAAVGWGQILKNKG